MDYLPYKMDLLDYQIPVWQYINIDGGKFAILMWHRRSGKDVICFNIMVAQALLKVGYYIYFLPTQVQAREAIWNAMTKEGVKYLDAIPDFAIQSKNEQQMRIKLKNGSIIKFDGIDKFHAARGRGATGIVLSEYAHATPQAYAVLAPMIRRTDGWIIINSTPWGENHFYKLFLSEKKEMKSFTQAISIDQTGMVTPEEIEEDRRRGMSEQMIQQEYYVNPLSAVPGAYYADEIKSAYDQNRITNFSISTAPVYTFWDLGVKDATAIWVMQINHSTDKAMMIGYYENSGGAIVNAVHWLRAFAAQNSIKYATNYLPFDGKNRDGYDGISRISKVQKDNPDMNFELLQKPKDLISSIENARSVFHKVHFHETNCSQGIAALKEYRSHFDAKHAIFGIPVENWAIHGADAFRYFALAYLTKFNQSGPKFKVL